jgi:two-component system cell cycle sensor histidine kinase/response regulator CckA
VRRHVDRLAAPGDPLLDLLLETSPSGMLVLDGQGRIRRGNAIASRLLGPRVALDQKLLDHLAVEARAQAAAALRLAMTSQAASRFVARLVGTPEERHVSANAVPIPETAGPPAGCLLYLTDITRGRALEAELLQGQKLQAVGQLAGGIAHDFNNLLTTIITASDLILQRETLDEETRADAAHVHASAARGSALVKQLLGFSRQQAATPQALAVNVAIVSLADMLRRLLGSRLRLDLELAPADALVQVDPTQLDQVLVNLALNARAAMADRGVLTVRTVCLGLAGPTQVGPQTIPPGRYARIDVEDTGTGIPAAILPRIFDPFFTTRQDQGGTGLGLSTVQGIIRDSSGYLTVQSPPGRGACFSIFLPILEMPEAPEVVAQAAAATAAALADPAPTRPAAPIGPPAVTPAAPAAPVEAAPAEAAAAASTILLVDDEEGVLAIAARALKQRGWQVIACDSAEAALARDDIDRPAAVVSDVVMPGMDGPALVRALRARWPGLPAILVSGYAEGALRLDLAKSEVRFLPKPYTLKALAEALESLVPPPARQK